MHDDSDPPQPMLTLEQAAAKHFPGGSVTARTLQGYARRGKLKVYKIGKRSWTTDADVFAMVENCRVVHCDPTVTSSTDDGALALANARRTVRELRERIEHRSGPYSEADIAAGALDRALAAVPTGKVGRQGR